MDHVFVTRQWMAEETSIRFDPLFRAMAAMVDPLAKAWEGLEDGALEPAKQDSKQDALVAAFALLMARCQLGDAAGDLPGVLFEAGAVDQPRLHRALAPMRLLWEQSDDGADVIHRLTGLVLRSDPISILLEASKRGFTDRPLVYVFEVLLAAWDARLRRRRGIYFTPQPLTQFMVRSVDILLRRALGFAQGLAAAGGELRIVDPACGSGAFLLDVVSHVRSLCEPTRLDRAEPGSFPHHISDHIVGIDVMPACVQAAELLLEREVASGDRSCGNGIPIPTWSLHCGNALEEIPLAESLFEGRVPVILGNPPYSNFGECNRGAWIRRQLGEYKSLLSERKLNLDDDFIKFFRWAQYWIDRAGRGVLALVTSNTYLAGLTHRQMRESLAASFDEIHVLDLHGHPRMGELGAASNDARGSSSRDQNVFPIKQGVAIGLFVKSGRRRTEPVPSVAHAQLRGSRADKLRALSRSDVAQLDWTTLEACEPHHFFVPRDEPSVMGYEQWPRLDEIFCKYISGVQSKRDGLFVGFTKQELHDRMRQFLAAAGQGEFATDVPDWLRRKAQGVSYDQRAIRPYMVAPFDVRWIYYEPRLLGRARWDVMRHVDARNVVLVFMRQTTNAGSYDQVLATNVLVSDRVFFSAHGAPFAAPLFLQDDGQRSTNFRPLFLTEMSERLGVPYDGVPENGVPNDRGDGNWRESFGSLDVFHWIYANLHCPVYRRRFHAALRIDFPRIPWPLDAGQFHRFAEQGRRLLATHLDAVQHVAADREDDRHAHLAPLLVEPGYPRWSPSGKLALNRHQMWPTRVDEAVWQFRLGGYQVLARWIKQRRQRYLDGHDQEHLHRTAAAIDGTVHWMRRVPGMGDR